MLRVLLREYANSSFECFHCERPQRRTWIALVPPQPHLQLCPLRYAYPYGRSHPIKQDLINRELHTLPRCLLGFRPPDSNRSTFHHGDSRPSASGLLLHSRLGAGLHLR